MGFLIFCLPPVLSETWKKRVLSSSDMLVKLPCSLVGWVLTNSLPSGGNLLHERTELPPLRSYIDRIFNVSSDPPWWVRGGMKWTKRNPQILWGFGPRGSSWIAVVLVLGFTKVRFTFTAEFTNLTHALGITCQGHTLESSHERQNWDITNTWIHLFLKHQGLKGLQRSTCSWLPSETMPWIIDPTTIIALHCSRSAFRPFLPSLPSFRPSARWLFDRSINPIRLRIADGAADPTDRTNVEARVVSVVGMGWIWL